MKLVSEVVVMAVASGGKWYAIICRDGQAVWKSPVGYPTYTAALFVAEGLVDAEEVERGGAGNRR